MFKKYSFLFMPVLASALCSLLFLTSLDDKVYDLFLRAIPSLTENNSILIIEVDDTAIESVGIFPWTRDIYADAMIFLKEMNAGTVAFDLSFLDDSPVIVNPDYITKELPAYIDSEFRRIDNTVEAVMDAFASGDINASDAEDAKELIRETNTAVRNELEVSIDYISRDVDAYFAQALKFFGNSYLTLTMVAPEDILSNAVTGEASFDMSRYNLSWLEENTALKNITIRSDRHTPDQPGIMPAILKLMSETRGAGFVNSVVDKDGYRRRLHLVMKHNDHYYGHLALVALRESLCNPDIEVSAGYITLRYASINGEAIQDIRIPRTQDGSVLLKWPRKNFYGENGNPGYNTMSFRDLAQANAVERALVINLGVMADSGFFGFWEDGENPLERYENANYIKEELFYGEDPDGGISFDAYMQYRKDFISAAGSFLFGGYEAAISNSVNAPDVKRFIQRIFAESQAQFSRLVALRSQVAEKVAGATCIVGLTATSGTDLGLITFQERYPNVGIYSVIANQILSGEFLDDTPTVVSFLIALLLSLVVAFVVKQLDIGKSILAGIIAMAVAAAVPLLFFIITRRYVGTVVPFVSTALTFLSLTGLNFFSTIREKSQLRNTFNRYLSPAVIDQIIADPSKLTLGGVKKQMTAIFTDVRSFSTITEALGEE
ncbi:MAG: CHASE2 domain-containing protein, partial [Treponema sp.]|nr:CHASE2 domain-containing protein [Treponema sp.]